MVQDLYVLMITAAVVSIVFKFLKQPVVLGYIVAGVLVGPHLFGETLVNEENVKAWGDIGRADGVALQHRHSSSVRRCRTGQQGHRSGHHACGMVHLWHLDYSRDGYAIRRHELICRKGSTYRQEHLHHEASCQSVCQEHECS